MESITVEVSADAVILTREQAEVVLSSLNSTLQTYPFGKVSIGVAVVRTAIRDQVAR